MIRLKCKSKLFSFFCVLAMTKVSILQTKFNQNGRELAADWPINDVLDQNVFIRKFD